MCVPLVVLGLAVALPVVGSHPPLAPPTSWRVAAPGGIATARVLRDGQTLALKVRNADGAVSGASGCNVRALPLGGGASGVRLTLSPPWRWREQVVREDAGIVAVAEPDGGVGADLLRRVPRSVPSAYRSAALASAETALRSRDLERAAARFTALRLDYVLRSWAELRLADIALLSGRRADACRGYAALRAKAGERTVGLLGALRATAAVCGTETARWQDLLARSSVIEGMIGAFLRREVVAALAREGGANMDEAMAAVSSSPVCRVDLAGPCVEARWALVARQIRAGDALAAVVAHRRYAAELKRHPEAGDLLVTIADAYLALDLPHAAKSVLDELEATPVTAAPWTRSELEAQNAWLRVRVAELVEDDGESRRLTEAFVRRFGVAPARAPTVVDTGLAAGLLQDLDEVVERLEAVTRAATSETSETSVRGGLR